MASELDNGAAVILEAGKQLARAELSKLPVDGAPFVVFSNGVVKSVEKFLDAPRRVRATVTARTTQGLIDYVKVHKKEGTSVFAWAGDNSFLAVIDYHQPFSEGGTVADPVLFPAISSWCSHRVALTLALSPDWQRWIGANKVKMGQEDFAAFIEDNMQNIAKPPGAELFEMARQLWATKSVQFGSSVRLDNGQHQLRYEETVTGSAGKKGQFNIPTEFTLGLPPFEGSALYEVTARFRYRIENGGVLKLWFDLLRPEVVIENAYNAERAKIATTMAELGVSMFDAKFGSVDVVDAV